MKYFVLFLVNFVIFCALSWLIFIGVGSAVACMTALLWNNVSADAMLSVWLYSLVVSIAIAAVLMTWGWYRLYCDNHPRRIPPAWTHT